MTSHDPVPQNTTDRALKAVVDGNPADRFELLYVAAKQASTSVPWDQEAPCQQLVDRATEGAFCRHNEATVLVVACGVGHDAEFMAGLGFEVSAFDVAPTAIEMARQRFPQSSVRYSVADLFAVPSSWLSAFDLVVESMTLQSLPIQIRARAGQCIGSLVAPNGTLMVFSRGRNSARDDEGPPWSLTKDEICSIESDDLRLVDLNAVRADDDQPDFWKWIAEFRRTGG